MTQGLDTILVCMMMSLKKLLNRTLMVPFADGFLNPPHDKENTKLESDRKPDLLPYSPPKMF